MYFFHLSLDSRARQQKKASLLVPLKEIQHFDSVFLGHKSDPRLRKPKSRLRDYKTQVHCTTVQIRQNALCEWRFKTRKEDVIRHWSAREFGILQA